MPPYCRSATGRVFRLLRSSRLIAPDRIRYLLRAEPLGPDGSANALELTREVDTEFVLDKVAHRQAVPTPEATFEALWQQLRVEIDARDG